MDELSRQLFAVALAATWCGFGLYGLARMAARSPQVREVPARLRRSGPLGDPWTARVAGYFELQGKITVDGHDAYTPMVDIEVQFPSYDQIWSATAFIGLANQERPTPSP